MDDISSRDPPRNGYSRAFDSRTKHFYPSAVVSEKQAICWMASGNCHFDGGGTR